MLSDEDAPSSMSRSASFSTPDVVRSGDTGRGSTFACPDDQMTQVSEESQPEPGPNRDTHAGTGYPLRRILPLRQRCQRSSNKTQARHPRLYVSSSTSESLRARFPDDVRLSGMSRMAGTSTVDGKTSTRNRRHKYRDTYHTAPCAVTLNSLRLHVRCL